MARKVTNREERQYASGNKRKHDHVAVVTMTTNKVSAQNPAFLDDLHTAFDRLEAEFNDSAVILIGTGAVFSTDLDFNHHFLLLPDNPSERSCVV